MKVENLKIGKTYYMPTTGFYTCGELIKITKDKKAVLKNKKGELITVSPNKLHNRADKAVVGKRQKDAARHAMKAKKQKERESLVDTEIQKKVKRLGHSTYATKEYGKYVVNGWRLGQERFDTLAELEKWADIEYEKLQCRREKIRSKGYKYLKTTNKKSGESTYYRCIGFAFPKFIIRCKEFRGDYNNIPENLVLKREEVPEMKIDIQK